MPETFLTPIRLYYDRANVKSFLNYNDSVNRNIPYYVYNKVLNLTIEIIYTVTQKTKPNSLCHIIFYA